jgi:hypothetical protein
MKKPKPLTIQGNYSINLDEFFDIESLDNIFYDIVEGVVLSKEYFEPVVIGSKYAQYDESINEVTIHMKEELEEEIEKLKAKGLTESQIYDYVKYGYPTVSFGNKLLLRTYNNYHAGFGVKHLERLNHDTPAYANFESLRTWLNNCGAFSEIGRILLFITERHCLTEVHCDYADGKTRKDQFLWINPRKKKKFFVLDETLNKKYLTGVINTFDNASWHGSEPAETACFSIRVDGKFSDSFLNRTGLGDHFLGKKE